MEVGWGGESKNRLSQAFTELESRLPQKKRAADSETGWLTAVYGPAQTHSPLAIAIYVTIVKYKSSGNSEVDTYPVWSFLVTGAAVSAEEQTRQLRAAAASGFPDEFTCHHKCTFLLLT